MIVINHIIIIIIIIIILTALRLDHEINTIMHKRTKLSHVNC